MQWSKNVVNSALSAGTSPTNSMKVTSEYQWDSSEYSSINTQIKCPSMPSSIWLVSVTTVVESQTIKIAAWSWQSWRTTTMRRYSMKRTSCPLLEYTMHPSTPTTITTSSISRLCLSIHCLKSSVSMLMQTSPRIRMKLTRLSLLCWAPSRTLQAVVQVSPMSC